MKEREQIKPGALRTVFLWLGRPELAHDVTELVRILAGRCDVVLAEEMPPRPEAGQALLTLGSGEGMTMARFVWPGGESQESLPLSALPVDAVGRKRILRWTYKQAAYRAMRPCFSTETPWGSLTGIRPSKLLRSMLAKDGLDGALRQLRVDFDVCEEKIQLLLAVLDRQAPVLSSISPGDVDLYIGIPFCRTRCQYCSFAAYALEGQGGRRGISPLMVQDYLDCLVDDIQVNLAALRERGYRIRSVYFGGGTPTSIGREALERLLNHTLQSAGGPVQELCVEAGRPDSIDRDTLCMLKDMGVNRISINPQSMNQKTLDAIGRDHSPEDIEKAFAQARSIGFDDINMDIILGLPGEDRTDFAYTLERIREMSPDGLTVHALAVKRASRLREELRADETSVAMVQEREAAAMQHMAAETAASLGLGPYYMYRQKYSAGNLENVGYAAPGKECIYNIDIMEECCSILALGAGAISKWRYDDGQLKRFANPKDLKTYIEKKDELNEKRGALYCTLEGTGTAKD